MNELENVPIELNLDNQLMDPFHVGDTPTANQGVTREYVGSLLTQYKHWILHCSFRFLEYPSGEKTKWYNWVREWLGDNDRGCWRKVDNSTVLFINVRGMTQLGAQRVRRKLRDAIEQAMDAEKTRWREAEPPQYLDYCNGDDLPTVSVTLMEAVRFIDDH